MTAEQMRQVSDAADARDYSTGVLKRCEEAARLGHRSVDVEPHLLTAATAARLAELGYTVERVGGLRSLGEPAVKAHRVGW